MVMIRSIMMSFSMVLLIGVLINTATAQTIPDSCNVSVQFLTDESGSIQNSDLRSTIAQVSEFIGSLMSFNIVDGGSGDMDVMVRVSHFNDGNRVLVPATRRFADIVAYNASEQNQLTRATNGGTATGRALNRTFSSLPAEFAARLTKILIIITDGLSLEQCARVGGLVTSPLSTDDGNCIARASARWSDAGWKVYVVALVNSDDACGTDGRDRVRRQLDSPTDAPSAAPTDAPSVSPSASPSDEPSAAPTATPSVTPSDAPSDAPSQNPTDIPTDIPTDFPTDIPTDTPTNNPTTSTTTSATSTTETSTTTSETTTTTTISTANSFFADADQNTLEHLQTITFPRDAGFWKDSCGPSGGWSDSGSVGNDNYTMCSDGVSTCYTGAYDTCGSTSACRDFQSLILVRGADALVEGALLASLRTVQETLEAECLTSAPTRAPTDAPTQFPTSAPTQAPTNVPSDTPTTSPSDSPTNSPTDAPSGSPTAFPTANPTRQPTVSPSDSPTDVPTTSPTGAPTSYPTAVPTDTPTLHPTTSTTTTITSSTTTQTVTTTSTISSTTSTSTNTAARGSFNCRSDDEIYGSTEIGQPVIDDDVDLTTGHTYYTTVAYRDFGVTNLTFDLVAISGSCRFLVIDPSGSAVQDTGKLTASGGNVSLSNTLVNISAGGYSVEIRGSGAVGTTCEYAFNVHCEVPEYDLRHPWQYHYDNGTAGATGPQGDRGSMGIRGAQGTGGENGIRGDDGADGAKGEPGAVGDDGYDGSSGDEGDSGPDGVPGGDGDKGFAGVSDTTVYVKGQKGAQGAPGPQGEQGTIGDTGESGLTGAPGLKGDDHPCLTFQPSNGSANGRALFFVDQSGSIGDEDFFGVLQAITGIARDLVPNGFFEYLFEGFHSVVGVEEPCRVSSDVAIHLFDTQLYGAVPALGSYASDYTLIHNWSKTRVACGTTRGNETTHPVDDPARCDPLLRTYSHLARGLEPEIDRSNPYNGARPYTAANAASVGWQAQAEYVDQCCDPADGTFGQYPRGGFDGTTGLPIEYQAGTATKTSLQALRDAYGATAQANLNQLTIVTDGVTNEICNGTICYSAVEDEIQRFVDLGWEVLVFAFVGDAYVSSTRENLEHLSRLTYPRDSGVWIGDASSTGCADTPCSSVADVWQASDIGNPAHNATLFLLESQGGRINVSSLQHALEAKSIDVYRQQCRATQRTMNCTAVDGRHGRDGTPGRNGENGNRGIKGMAGEKGFAGQDGSPGADGAVGPQGVVGDTGSPGAVGPQGSPGDKGRQGDKGNAGVDGVDGVVGDTGDKGRQGNRGMGGENGLRGSPGPDAAKGLKGLTGDVGEKGRAGQPGWQGRRGSAGYVGDIGEPGAPGENGNDGVAGNKGQKGDNGPVGDNNLGEKGHEGTKGEAGYTGPQGVKGIKGHAGAVPDTCVDHVYRERFVNATEVYRAAIATSISERRQICGGGAVSTDLTAAVDAMETYMSHLNTSYRAMAQSAVSAATDAMTATFSAFEREFNRTHEAMFNRQRNLSLSTFRCANLGRKGLGSDVGIKGIKGMAGDRGDMGETGTPGAAGAHGRDGEDGEAGDKGIKGLPGDKGVKGQAGAAGQGGKGERGSPGEDGTPGSDGAPGLTGDASTLKGEHGAPGLPGDRGDTGRPGIKGQPGQRGPFFGRDGRDGTPGARGNPGQPGSIGDKGARGTNGTDGIDGVDGDPGMSGDVGDDGSQGDTGIAGDSGDPGIQGAKGVAGPDGTNGTKGRKGVAGSAGAPGSVGAVGDKGFDGDSGVAIQGDKGIKGHRGLWGNVGNPGSPGAPGDKGDKGIRGIDGPRGMDGADGEEGVKGEQGIKGEAAATGPTGSTGLKGYKGLLGATGQHGDIGFDGADSACLCTPEYAAWQTMMDLYELKYDEGVSLLDSKADALRYATALDEAAHSQWEQQWAAFTYAVNRTVAVFQISIEAQMRQLASISAAVHAELDTLNDAICSHCRDTLQGTFGGIGESPLELARCDARASTTSSTSSTSTTTSTPGPV
eukprot:m.480126 g.480126  ORF g.480126 m.480126 type:complete len:2012 (+) comp21706_c0_seq1:229-6264(+)